MGHDIKSPDMRTQRDDFRHTYDAQHFATAGCQDFRSFFGKRWIATDLNKCFWWDKTCISARIDQSANSSGIFGTNQFGPNNPEGWGRTHLDGDTNSGWKWGTGKNLINAAFSRLNSVKVFFLRTMNQQTPGFRHKRSLIEIINIDQQPFIFISIQKFFDWLRLFVHRDSPPAAMKDMISNSVVGNNFEYNDPSDQVRWGYHKQSSERQTTGALRRLCGGGFWHIMD